MTTPDNLSSTSLSTASLSTTAVDYDEQYFRTGLGLPYDEQEPHWGRFFGDVADNLVRQVAPRSCLDVGCAKGFLVAALLDRGIDARGVDISDYAITAAVERVRDRVAVHDLTQPLEGSYDLITVIEVIEHMAPTDTQLAIDNICAATDRIFFSSTPYDYAEPTHVNLHPTATWAGWFAQRGFFRRTDLDLTYLSPWAMIVERAALRPADVAYRYETELAPLREEVVGKRQALLDLHRTIDDLHHTIDDAPAEPSTAQLANVERVLGLTDEVIGLRAELAESQYRTDLLVQAQTEEEAARRAVLESELAAALERANGAEQLVTRLLASRSWRSGQAIARSLRAARRAVRPSP